MKIHATDYAAKLKDLLNKFENASFDCADWDELTDIGSYDDLMKVLDETRKAIVELFDEVRNVPRS